MNEKQEQTLRLMDHVAFLMTAAFTVAIFARPNEIYEGLGIMGLQRVLGIAAIITCFLSMKGRIKGVFNQRIIWFIAIYLFAIILSVPFSLWPGGSVQFLTDYLLKQTAILLVIITVLRTEKQMSLLAKLIVYSSVIVAAHTIYRYAAGEVLIQGYRASLAQGLFSDPNDLSLHLVFSMPFAYYLIYRQSKHKLPSLLIMAIIAAGVLVTFSRGGMLGLCAIAAGIWYFDRERRKMNSAAILAVFLAVLIFLPASVDRVSTLIEYNSKPEDSMMQRWKILKEGIKIFGENPLTGVGVRCFSISEGSLHGGVGEWKDAHNSFIQVAAETGILGLIGFAGCIILILKSRSIDARGDPKKYFLQSGIRTSAIGYVVCGLFLSQAYSWYLFYLLAFTILFNALSTPAEPAEMIAEHSSLDEYENDIAQSEKILY